VIAKLVLAASAAMIAASLSGCAYMPGAGPSGDSIVESGTPTERAPNVNYALIEVDDSSLSLLQRRGAPSLRGFFGDYRPPAAQAIGVGDSLTVTVWEAAAGGLFSTPVTDHSAGTGSRSVAIPDQIVGRDGSVTVPYAGRIHVAGRTQQQVEAAIVERLRGKAIEPQALVNLSRNVTNTVTVAGEVANGARVPLTLRGDRIMDVIAAAGGFRSPVHETFVNLTRGGRTARAPIQALLANPAEDIFVRPGDILTVERTPQTFTAVGASGLNAVVPFDARGVSLEEAIGRAGGLLDYRADPAGVFVLRYEPATLLREFPSVSPALLHRSPVPVAYHLNMRDPQSLFLARRFAMRDKDVLYISNSTLTEIAKVFQLVQMISSPAIQGAAVSQIVK